MAVEEIRIPDIGTDGSVDVIEVLIKSGDTIDENDSLITLESDKASMEVPAPKSGVVQQVSIKVGDKVSEGDLILTFESLANGKAEAVVEKSPEVSKPVSAPKTPAHASQSAPPKSTPAVTAAPTGDLSKVHAGPGVRRFARELGVDLTRVPATGPKGRIIKHDVESYVKQALLALSTGVPTVAAAPEVDFTKFGEVEIKPLKKIKRLTAQNMSRAWNTIPHVTQFDEADITELEKFRQARKKEAEQQGFKLTPLAFVMKAVVACLKEFPQFNSSLDSAAENLIKKKFFHIGVAVDTPNGLLVPVIRDVDQKGIFDLAKELGEISQKAREKGLMPKEMAGSCFTISSLGGISGTAFTPIVNAPDVAILGVSKSKMKPVYQHDEFVPRLMLPLSLSYDHRVIDGAEAARFSKYLVTCLADIRQLVL